MAEQRIPLVKVESTNIYAVGYDTDNAVMAVQFRSGGLYYYYDVPKAIYDGMLEAESKGRFLHQFVKGLFKYRKVAARPKAAPKKS